MFQTKRLNTKTGHKNRVIIKASKKNPLILHKQAVKAKINLTKAGPEQIKIKILEKAEPAQPNNLINAYPTLTLTKIVLTAKKVRLKNLAIKNQAH